MNIEKLVTGQIIVGPSGARYQVVSVSRQGLKVSDNASVITRPVDYPDGASGGTLTFDRVAIKRFSYEE